MKRRWIALCLASVLSPCHSEVTLDGTMGSAGPLSGPDYQIGADLGRQKDSNLFHSFGAFNINRTESATFTGPDSVANILARVTGGSASNIDGTLATSFANAAPNLFFMNPAGVVFGPNARLDVQGSFHISTADFLEFGDGSRFNANPASADALLTTAPPGAFGFLAENPTGDITVNGSDLEVPLGATFSIVGGNITVSGGTVAASSGRLQVKGQTLTVRDGGRLETSTTSFDDAGDVDVFAQDIRIANGSQIVADTRARGRGGNVSIRGETLELSDGSRISARSDAFFSDSVSGRIFIFSSDSLRILRKSSISTETVVADAGDIDLNVGTLLLLRDQSTISTASGVTAAGVGDADGGDIRIDPTFVILDGGSEIIANTQPGRGGNILISTDFLFLSLDSIVDASSELALDILSPAEDVVASTLDLPESFLAVPTPSTNPCEARARGDASTFIVSGRGVPPGPENVLPSLILDVGDSLGFDDNSSMDGPSVTNRQAALILGSLATECVAY